MDQIVLLECQFSLALVLMMIIICKKKDEVGEDENSKKVLGAANVSRANKSQSLRIILFSQGCDTTTGNISSGIMNFLCILLITETQSEKKNTPEHQLNWQHYQ